MLQREKSKSNDRAMRLYLNEIAKIPLLSADEEKELARRAQRGDREALQKLIESNLRFVIKIAKGYRGSGLPFLELINQGNLGLIEAARRYDPERDVRFTTYSVWWIRQSILFYISQSSKIFRVSPKTANILYRVGNVLRRRNELNDSLNKETLAAEIGVSQKELSFALEAAAPVLSFDQPIDQSDPLFLRDTLEQTVIPSSEDRLIQTRLRESMEKSLGLLEPIEAQIVRMRFGLEDGDPMTLKRIGDKMHLSRERIRQLEMRALDKLRKSSSVQSLAAYLN